MKNLFKYIIFFVFCFNIGLANAQDLPPSESWEQAGTSVLFSPVESDDTIDTSFKGVVNLPHAADMQRLLNNSSGYIENFLLIGSYFHFKYPEERINADFEEDVSAIFPQENVQTISFRTSLIRHGVNFYRWGMAKFNEIKEKIMAPPEAPLIVDDDDFTDDEPYTYIETPPDQFAIKNDFKRVVTYSNNPREAKAVQARKERQLAAKKQKTNLDQFRSMFNKIEFSKIPYYGFELENPLIGNAGSIDWETKDGFKVRLISELAEYGQNASFLGGIHVQIPAHRFMLATDLNEEILKPQIEFIGGLNVKDIEFYYPLPENLFVKRMLGIYMNDFLFPFKITPLEKSMPVAVTIRFSFTHCDMRLDCAPMEFVQTLDISAQENDLISSYQNFVRQSYNNLPADTDPKIILADTALELSEDKKEIENILLTFKYNGRMQNIRFFLEDDLQTTFAQPIISADDDSIFVTFKPLNNKDLLFNKPLTLSAQLNPFTRIRQTLNLDPEKISDISLDTLRTARSAFWSGFLLFITPIGFLALILILILSAQEGLESQRKNFIWGILTASLAATILLSYLHAHQFNLYWGMQYQSKLYLCSVVFLLLTLMKLLYRPLAFYRFFKKTQGFWLGVSLIFMIPFSFTPHLKEVLFQTYLQEQAPIIRTFSIFTLGLFLPYIIFLFTKFRISKKLVQDIKKFCRRYVLLELAAILIIFGLQTGLVAMIKAALFTLLLLLVIEFFFIFDQKLDDKLLNVQNKDEADKGLVFASVLALFLFIKILPDIQISDQNQTIPSPEEISAKLKEGKNVLLQVNSDWCFICKYHNNFTFRGQEWDNWQKEFNLEIITLDANHPSAELEAFLQQYGYVSAPLYVLYTTRFQHGYVLSPMMTLNQLYIQLQNLTS